MALAEVGITAPDPVPPLNLAAERTASALYLDGSPATMQVGSRAQHAVDGVLDTFTQASGRFRWQLEIDLQVAREIEVLQVSQPAHAYATAFHVDASIDGRAFTRIGRSTRASSGDTSVSLDRTLARQVRIVADEPSGPGQPGNQMALSEILVSASN